MRIGYTAPFGIVQAVFTQHQSRQKTLLSTDLPAVLAAVAPSMSCGETELLACMLDPAGVGTLTLPSLLAGLADSLALMNASGRCCCKLNFLFPMLVERESNTALPFHGYLTASLPSYTGTGV